MKSLFLPKIKWIDTWLGIWKLIVITVSTSTHCISKVVYNVQMKSLFNVLTQNRMYRWRARSLLWTKLNFVLRSFHGKRIGSRQRRRELTEERHTVYRNPFRDLELDLDLDSNWQPTFLRLGSNRKIGSSRQLLRKEIVFK